MTHGTALLAEGSKMSLAVGTETLDFLELGAGTEQKWFEALTNPDPDIGARGYDRLLRLCRGLYRDDGNETPKGAFQSEHSRVYFRFQ